MMEGPEEGKREAKLLVGDARQRDVGRGIARINQRICQKLGISAGDVIEIIGKRSTTAIAWPAYSEDQTRDVIRLDWITRKNAEVEVGEYVIVRPARVKEALSITLAPVDMRLFVDEYFINFLRDRLSERTFVEGDTILLWMLEQKMFFKVIKTEPHGPVVVKPTTKLNIMSEPPEMAEAHADMQRLKKELRRFAWLKAKEREYASDYTRFYVEGMEGEEFNEDSIMSKAKELAKSKNEDVTIYVIFYERRGKIGTLEWAKVKPDGAVNYIYPDDQLKICPYCDEPLTMYYGRYYCHRCSRYL